MATPQLNSCSARSHTDILNLHTPNKHSPCNSTSMVRVIVRVRPFLPHEISRSTDAGIDKAIACVSVLDSPLQSASEVTVSLKDPHSCRNENYKLDSFYGQEDNNLRRIFEREVMPLIPAVLNGYNATVFAYGATGSGKTFTMQGTDELPGLMPMAASTILSMGKTVEISYYEIYMERCYDLLQDTPKEITILDDKDGRPHLRNLAKIPIHSMADFHEAFLCGLQRRKVAHTGLNDVSSRSHGVLVISVSRPCENGPGNTLVGKLNLIDLAGNEDNRRSGNEGVRLIESQKINQSLFALSNVIYALNNKNSRIPYRESKLTRILQDSLGGNSHAVMVACLNPGEYEQSVHTVSLAARSRHITNVHSAQKHNNNNNNNNNTPKTEVDMEAKLRAWLESRGRTKSTLCSASLAKTPRSMKKLNTGKPNPKATLEEKAQKVENELKSDSSRKVLFPINCNIIIDPVTPKQQQQSVADDTDTPLNKFKAMSCNLKTTLAQEYINFLNKADKVELLQLKGIGEKMAEYILELRDMSPLKSLNDLEKIGISSKQVGNMFGRTAKGLFD